MSETCVFNSCTFDLHFIVREFGRVLKLPALTNLDVEEELVKEDLVDTNYESLILLDLWTKLLEGVALTEEERQEPISVQLVRFTQQHMQTDPLSGIDNLQIHRLPMLVKILLMVELAKCQLSPENLDTFEDWRSQREFARHFSLRDGTRFSFFNGLRLFEELPNSPSLPEELNAKPYTGMCEEEYSRKCYSLICWSQKTWREFLKETRIISEPEVHKEVDQVRKQSCAGQFWLTRNQAHQTITQRAKMGVQSSAQLPSNTRTARRVQTKPVKQEESNVASVKKNVQRNASQRIRQTQSAIIEQLQDDKEIITTLNKSVEQDESVQRKEKLVQEASSSQTIRTLSPPDGHQTLLASDEKPPKSEEIIKMLREKALQSIPHAVAEKKVKGIICPIGILEAQSLGTLHPHKPYPILRDVESSTQLDGHACSLHFLQTTLTDITGQWVEIFLIEHVPAPLRNCLDYVCSKEVIDVHCQKSWNQLLSHSISIVNSFSSAENLQSDSENYHLKLLLSRWFLKTVQGTIRIDGRMSLEDRKMLDIVKHVLDRIDDNLNTADEDEYDPEEVEKFTKMVDFENFVCSVERNTKDWEEIESIERSKEIREKSDSGDTFYDSFKREFAIFSHEWNTKYPDWQILASEKDVKESVDRSLAEFTQGIANMTKEEYRSFQCELYGHLWSHVKTPDYTVSYVSTNVKRLFTIKLLHTIRRSFDKVDDSILEKSDDLFDKITGLIANDLIGECVVFY